MADPRPLPARLAGRPITRAEATALGLTARTLDHRRFQVLHRGVSILLDGANPSLHQQVTAALKVLPADTVVTGTTGLQLYGVEVGPPLPLQFATSHPHPVRRPSLRVRRVRALPPHQGYAATPAACFRAAAPELSLLAAVSAGDRLLHLRRCALDDLTAACRTSGAGGAAARTALALVRSRVESPRETWLRLLLVLAGLPEPACNLTIGNDERPIGRADLVYLAFRLILEYDGSQHLRDRRQWNIDIIRLEEFAQAGFTVLRVPDHRLRRPRRLVLDVLAHLRRAGYEGPDPVFSSQWCDLFEH